ncbi:hypothetical protein EYC84_004569 [Monilinia fructicola]|uniref:Uncharacterized protein n=1 Tax=Monilinia fructicola TaxID=38448 RepID=A0A5M9K5V7_MONFR|nr:hypothetical protein EYC84_004569 [Monilinia fructicola]
MWVYPYFCPLFKGGTVQLYTWAQPPTKSTLITKYHSHTCNPNCLSLSVCRSVGLLVPQSHSHSHSHSHLLNKNRICNYFPILLFTFAHPFFTTKGTTNTDSIQTRYKLNQPTHPSTPSSSFCSRLVSYNTVCAGAIPFNLSQFKYLRIADII